MKLVIGVLTTLALLPATVAAPAAAISTAPHPAPAAPLFAWVPPGGYPDRFPYGQCTWWAAYNRQVTWSGNAGDWLANAAAAGRPIQAVPSAGAIAVYRPGPGYHPWYGHVAVVTAVAPGSYSISEMNFSGWGVVDTRSIGWPDPRAEGFIPLSGDER